MRRLINNVTATLIVELTCNTQRDHYFFTDEWNFQVDKFVFKKKSESELEISFSFEAALTRRDDKRNITHQEMPSEHTRKFQGEEERLETLLDLISLAIGYGLKIRPDSYLFSCPTSRDNPVVNNLAVDRPNTNDIEQRYQKLVKNTGRKKGLIAALRAYRRSLWNEEPSDRVPKLYSALEQAYGQGAGGNMLSKDELKKIGTFLDSLKVSKDKKNIVMSRLQSIPLKSPSKVLVEKIGLMNENGEVTDKEKRELFTFWRKARSIPAHGSILPKRGEQIQILLHDLESTVEALLYGEVRPKLIHYFLFKQGLSKPEFIKNKGKLIGALGDYAYFAVRNDELKIYLQHISREITTSDGVVYMISPSATSKIDKDGNVEEVSLGSLNGDLKKMVEKIVKKLS